MVRPQVSIVLGTYNRLPFLKATIAGVRASQFEEPYEIIVVDGGSTDVIELLADHQGFLLEMAANCDFNPFSI